MAGEESEGRLPLCGDASIAFNSLSVTPAAFSRISSLVESVVIPRAVLDGRYDNRLGHLLLHHRKHVVVGQTVFVAFWPIAETAPIGRGSA